MEPFRSIMRGVTFAISRFGQLESFDSPNCLGSVQGGAGSLAAHVDGGSCWYSRAWPRPYRVSCARKGATSVLRGVLSPERCTMPPLASLTTVPSPQLPGAQCAT